MNKLILFLSGIIALCTISSCSDDDINYSFQVNDFTAEAREGAIMLRWELPQDSDFHFIKIEYFNIRQQKEIVCNKSIYSDSLLVDGLLARDGEYHFSLTAVNGEGVASNITATTSCSPLPVQPTITRRETLLENVEIVNFSTNAQEPTEGPLSNLFDGDNGTFFHTPWSTGPVPYPQYVQIDLSEAVNGAKFITINRNNGGGGRPDHVEILGSNDQQNWDKLFELYGSTDIPDQASGKYQSPMIDGGEIAYKYYRYNVLSAIGGNSFWNMAEMQWSFYKVTEDIYDPENEVE